jgi:ornithine carbamoyltransferase
MTSQATHLLAVHDLSRDAILALFKEAAELKAMRRRALSAQRLSGKTLGLFFEKPSTRTRVSFETGMNQLGGQSIFLSVADIQMRRGETVADTAKVLSRYLDGLVIRCYEHHAVEEWARNATIPVINGLTDLHHPCQVLSDLFTIREKKRRWKGVKIAYVGDGNNVANSLIEGAAIMGMAISVACPQGYEPDASIVEWSRERAEQTGASIEIIRDPFVAVKGADVLYTDVWTSMGQEKEQARRIKVLAAYQLNGRLLAAAHPDAVVMHCLPAHRGQEIAADVLDGPQSVVLDQAENRLHVQKAILIRLLRDR